MTLRRVLLIPLALLLCTCGEVGGGTYWDATVQMDGFIPFDVYSPQNDGTVIDDDAGACVTATYQAEQTPLALMVVLDKSDSMAQQNRWTFAAQAIVQALDQDVFDSVYVGLYASPTSTVTGPSCVFGFPVGCGGPPFPQVDLALAGAEKSNDTTGVRRTIKDWLTNNAPGGAGLDGTPMYDALTASIGAIQMWSQQGKRALLVVTDGSFSCTSLSSRSGYMDGNGCPDWEYPQNIIDLVSQAEQNTTTPVLTFVIGVPGSDTYDAQGISQPPYHMQGALSSIALAGAPVYMSPTCDAAPTFVAPGSVPTESCHFDMTLGNFNIQAVSDAISWVRGQTMGCTYELPDPPGGLEVTEVNVRTTIDGNVVDLAKRADPGNECLADDGCWDYDGAQENVELIGAACDAVQAGTSVQVDIILGCQTIVM